MSETDSGTAPSLTNKKLTINNNKMTLDGGALC